MAKNKDRRDAKQEDKLPKIRKVSKKGFKQKNIWIDTKYNSDLDPRNYE